MISHRRAALRVAFLAVWGVTLSSCDKGIDSPTRPIAPSSAASFSRKPHGVIATRVLVDKTGLATIEFRTGQVDDATNTQLPDGYFRDIEYKVYDLSGKNPKEILNRKVNFADKGGQLVSYAQTVPAKNGETRIDDKTPNPDKKDAKDVGPLAFDPTYLVVVKAHVRGLAADPKPDIEVRDTADVYFNPDLDLSAAKIQKVVVGPPSALVDLPTQVQIGVAQAYQVQFFNSAGAGATVGAQVTCEVHVLAGTNDVTPSITYRWLPNGRPEFDATKPGSPVSDTVTIYPNDAAACRFTMTLPSIGDYRIQVKANAVYPSDFDPSNNETTGVVSAVAGTPIDPPPGGGFGANATADDYYFTGITGGQFTPFIGDSAQRAQIEKLSSTIVTNNGLSGTFELKIKFSTIDTIGGGTLTAPSGTRILATATWTGSLPGLVAAATLAPNHCVSSDGFGTITSVASNLSNHLEALICVVGVSATELSIGTNLHWGPSIEGSASVVSAANGGQYFGDYLIWDTDLKLSDLPAVNPVSHAPVPLSGGPFTAAGSGGDVKPCLAFFPTTSGAVPCSFSAAAQARVHRFK